MFPMLVDFGLLSLARGSIDWLKGSAVTSTSVSIWSTPAFVDLLLLLTASSSYVTQSRHTFCARLSPASSCRQETRHF